MTRWIITLGGAEMDLDRLVEWKADDWQITRHETRGVVLCGERFERLDDDASVRRVTGALVRQINRAAKLCLGGFQGVKITVTAEHRQVRDHQEVQGHDVSHVHLSVTARVTAQLNAVLIKASDTPDAPPQRPPGTDCVQLVAALEADANLAASLDYIEAGESWNNSYKAFEAICDSVKGRKALLETGWLTRSALSTFTRSAQPDRHHNSPTVEGRMTEAEGRAFILDLLEKLIAARCRAR
jgi:hypothetical protein